MTISRNPYSRGPAVTLRDWDQWGNELPLGLTEVTGVTCWHRRHDDFGGDGLEIWYNISALSKDNTEITVFIHPLDWLRGTLGGQRWTIWGEIEAKPNAIEHRLRIWIQLRIYSLGQGCTGRIDAKFGCNIAGELEEQNGMEDLNEIFAQFDAEGFKKIEKVLPLFALMS